MTTWMIVEDEPDLHDMLSEMISSIGHKVLGFHSGEEAIAWLAQVDDGHLDQEIPELALFDIRLPGNISGVDVAAHLRQSSAMQHIVIVMMTAYRLSPNEETAIIEHAMPDMFLYKPLPTFPEFRRRLEDLLM